MVTQIQEREKKGWICRDILNSLPDWFGIPDSIEEYAQNCLKLPMWADLDGGVVRGFIAFKPTSSCAGEVYVMGVRQEYHRKGVGRALFAALHEYAKGHEICFLTVKTVQMGRYPDYDKTNLFYQGLGFQELECFPTLWDEANPCQVYIMDVK